MTRKLLISFVAASLLAGCATSNTLVPGGTTPSISSPAPATIELPRLPPQGVVVHEDGELTFLDVDGKVLYTLPDYRLYYEWMVPGPVIVRRGRQFYLLDVAQHTLEPFETPEAAAAAARPQFQEGLELPLPPHPAGTDLSGFWAYALPSPDGDDLLAQWSGECEVPNAFFVVDGVPRPVTGETTFFGSPSSKSLGWSARGDALVYLPHLACGDDRGPGIYAFHGPGDGELLYPVNGKRSSARMWGIEPPAS